MISGAIWIIRYHLSYCLGVRCAQRNVYAHLKDFNVGENLSLNIKPNILHGNQIAGAHIYIELR